MADLRIVDAPEIPTENITGEEKIPTGGNGNYSISLDSLADYTKTKKDLADNISVDGKVNGVRQELDAHIEDSLNPHQVTKGQIGLGNVDNTADADKPVSNSTQSAIISSIAPKADKTYVDNQLALKASKVDVDSSLLTKADKTYVDSQDSSLQSQINQKATVAYLDSALEEQTQTVNTALSNLSTAANKFYPTLAEAEADIANISVNQPVTIGEAINGGLWHKATTESTNLTKSPYDPLTQAKGYTDAVSTNNGLPNLSKLSATTEFMDNQVGSEFELNTAKKYVVIDSQNNVLFDIEQYIDDRNTISQNTNGVTALALHIASINQNFNTNAITATKNTLVPFATGISPNRNIKVFDQTTAKETTITSSGDNYNVRQLQNDAIMYESDKQADVVGGLYYAQKPSLKEYPLVARKKIAFWGHSFMNDGNMATKVSTLTGFPLYNFGKSGASSTAIAARNGGKKTQYTPVGGFIPASGSVTLNPAVAGALGSWNNGTTAENLACSFAGIDGVFNWNGTTATFTRNATGSAVAVSQLTDLIVIPKTTTSTGQVAINTVYNQHDECITVIWAARNDDLVTIEQSVANIKAIVDNIKNKAKRVVVMPEFPNSSEKTGTAGATKLSNLNALLKTTFPEFYCEINGVDALQNFKDHYNPNSADDVTDIANGITPRSLRYDNLHPSLSLQANALYIGADVNAEFIYQFLTVKGWL